MNIIDLVGVLFGIVLKRVAFVIDTPGSTMLSDPPLHLAVFHVIRWSAVVDS